MNIDEVSKEGDLGPVWCFGPVGHLPLGDVMLAQKLALEADEQATDVKVITAITKAIAAMTQTAHRMYSADSDEVARAFRDDVARCSDMMSPGVRCLAGG
jgi:hypothetical protein